MRRSADVPPVSDRDTEERGHGPSCGFRDEQLEHIFPHTLGYFYQKIAESIDGGMPVVSEPASASKRAENGTTRLVAGRTAAVANGESLRCLT